MPIRCPESKDVPVDDVDLPLQCTEWSNEPDGRHVGSHHVSLPPALGGEYYWTNENPLEQKG